MKIIWANIFDYRIELCIGYCIYLTRELDLDRILGFYFYTIKYRVVDGFIVN